VLVNQNVLEALDALASLAPLHTMPGLRAMRRALETLPDLPHVACFDTAFHRNLPELARILPVPSDWAARRYGFHGLSLRWVAGRVAAARAVICHLGGGSSVTAVEHGRSVETTMGFSPLEGIPMSTRSGSIDPAVVLRELRRGRSVDEVERALNEESGLRAIGGSGSLRELEASDDPRARVALDLFCYRVAGAVASCTVALGGLDALVFTGGAGEHSPFIRAAVAQRLRFLGADLDVEANEGAVPDALLSAPSSTLAIHVIASREDVVIARDVRSLLDGGPTGEEWPPGERRARSGARDSPQPRGRPR
jgi:acetate kinase